MYHTMDNGDLMEIQDLDQPDEWKQEWIQFSKDPYGFIMFSGKNGTGKTVASEAIMNSVFVPVHLEKLFYTQSDLNRIWLSDIKKWGDIWYLTDRLCNAALLVLDDLGTRIPSEAFIDFLYTVIEKRDRRKTEIGTIITTNLNSLQFREMFGDAITSRGCSGWIYKFEGNDRRYQKSKARKHHVLNENFR